MRMCTEDYTVPGTCIRVKKDDLVSISVAGIHSDAGTPRLVNLHLMQRWALKVKKQGERANVINTMSTLSSSFYTKCSNVCQLPAQPFSLIL